MKKLMILLSFTLLNFPLVHSQETLECKSYQGESKVALGTAYVQFYKTTYKNVPDTNMLSISLQTNLGRKISLDLPFSDGDEYKDIYASTVNTNFDLDNNDEYLKYLQELESMQQLEVI